ncbi:MAG: protein kinase [Pirellulales bacterium]|nr:protein kinase [Pirellulales bacterium]
MQPERLGPYQILDQLGKGGMGTVYKALHVETNEPAAVKLLSAALAREEGFRDRFQSEIETLRKLNHPNIVRLFGFGEQDDQLFYGMELIEGSSLEEELGKGRRFDWREVVRIALEVCRALRHAHDRGVIHRDLKPGNLMLAADGRVKLSDFGIARLFGNTRLTSVGAIIGTAEYMAPEQAAGRTVEPRSDLYSLGVVLYVLLARRPVFKGKTLGEVLQKQQFEKPEPLRRYNTDVPEELERIILQLLEKDPERRIPNAMILGRVLEAMQHAMAMPGETMQADARYYAGEPLPAEAPSSDPAVTAPGGEISKASSSTAAPEAQPDPYAMTAAAGTSYAPSAEAASPEQKAAGRFIAVAEEDLDRKKTDEASSPLFSWQTGALVAALLAIGYGIWYSLQPPAADRLYQDVAAAKEDSFDALIQAEPEIKKFLEYYSSDPRASTLRRYQQEIDLYRLERRFDLRVRGLTGTEKLLPVERAYLEAIGLERTDPDRCIAKLRALIDLYGFPKKEEAGPTGECVTLARRKLQGMEEESAERAADHLKLINTRLDEADSLVPTDPRRARAMYQAVLELYAGKPWAATAIRRTKTALEQLKTNSTNP